MTASGQYLGEHGLRVRSGLFGDGLREHVREGPELIGGDARPQGHTHVRTKLGVHIADACEHELLALEKTYEVNVCLSNDAEVQRLNKEFRGKDKPTNVLSFACIDDDEFWDMLDKSADMELGDIILAFETLQREADEKHITVYAHYCHLLVHGFLHILGFDHQTDEEADEMESLETEILEQFSIDNPYQDAAED